jgi:hypothetical protein
MCRLVLGMSFFRWYSESGNERVLQNVDDTICRAEQEAFGNMTLLGAFKIKQVRMSY